MKTFLLTCTGLMVLAGIYGATDMSMDIGNGRLIEYEHVRDRHAKHLLAIIKTTGLKTIRYNGAGAGAEQKKDNTVAGKESKTEKGMAEEKGRTASEMIEIFGRGDIEIVEAVPTTDELERFEAERERQTSEAHASNSEVRVVTSAGSEK
jgi:hypothetical protein